MHREAHRPTVLLGPPWAAASWPAFALPPILVPDIGCTARWLQHNWSPPRRSCTHRMALLYPPTTHTAKATGPHDHQLEQTQPPASKLTATAAAFFTARAAALNCRRHHTKVHAPPAPHTHVLCQPRGPVPNCHPPEHNVDVCNCK